MVFDPPHVRLECMKSLARAHGRGPKRWIHSPREENKQGRPPQLKRLDDGLVTWGRKPQLSTSTFYTGARRVCPLPLPRPTPVVLFCLAPQRNRQLCGEVARGQEAGHREYRRD